MSENASPSAPASPLEGITVVDFTAHIAGPYATKILADLGARVLKVERPEGDPARRSPPFKDDVPGPDRSALYHFLNTNKESIVLDLKNRGSQVVVERLLALADLAVFSQSPSVLERLELDYGSVSSTAKGPVVYLTNFGFDGPYRDYRLSDTALYAMGGEMFSHGIASREPLTVGGTATLLQCGAMTSIAALGAIHGWEAHGTGQRVDVNMFETQVGSLDRRSSTILAYRFAGAIQGRAPAATVGLAGGVYPVADGFVEVTASFGDYWERFVEMVDDDRFRDPKWADPVFTAAPEAKEEADGLIYPWMLERTRQQVWERARGARAMVAPLFTGADLAEDGVLKGRGYWVEIETPELGRVPMIGRPYVFEKTPWALRRPAPTLGQDTDSILGLAGFGNSEIIEFRREGAVY